MKKLMCIFLMCFQPLLLCMQVPVRERLENMAASIRVTLEQTDILMRNAARDHQDALTAQQRFANFCAAQREQDPIHVHVPVVEEHEEIIVQAPADSKNNSVWRKKSVRLCKYVLIPFVAGGAATGAIIWIVKKLYK